MKTHTRSPQKTARALVGCAATLAGCATALSGCAGGGEGGSEGGFEVRDSAGVEIVVHEGPAESLALVEELRVGQLDAAREELLFYGIRDILMDDVGRIFVGNDQTATVRVFDAEGEFVREFGGKGQGPSEIPSMLNDLMWAGDRLAVIDWQRGGKTILFDTAGVFVESWMNTQADGTRISLAGFTPGGWLASGSDEARYDNTVPGRPYPQGRWLQRVVSPPDSLGEVALELPPYVLYGSTTTHGLDWGLFAPEESLAFDAEGRIYRSAGAEYRVDVWAQDGRPVRSIRRVVDSSPITDEHIAALRSMVRAQYDTMSAYDDAPGRRQEALERTLARVDEQATFPRPATAPPLGAMLVGRGGAIWVERPDARDPAEEWFARRHGAGFDRTPTVETRWDVFGPDGRFRGTVTLPPRFQPMAVSEYTVVGVLKDDFDVEQVVRFGIVGGRGHGREAG